MVTCARLLCQSVIVVRWDLITMSYRFCALRRRLFATPVALAMATPLAAQDTTPYSFANGDVGSPYTAYRAGIGHTDASTRPLDGSLRDAPPPEPVADWSGFYFGASAGGILGTTELDGGLSADIETNGYALSGHGGKNWQIGSGVIGVELDASTTSADGLESISGGITTKTEIDWLASARLRAGYATQNFLFYGTGGLAFTSSNVDITAPGFHTNASEFHTGYVVGAGAEMVIVDGINARVEALHYGFSGDTLPTPTGTSDLDLDVTTVRAGLSFKFK